MPILTPPSTALLDPLLATQQLQQDDHSLVRTQGRRRCSGKSSLAFLNWKFTRSAYR